jgi:hypothetical protein
MDERKKKTTGAEERVRKMLCGTGKGQPLPAL